MASSMSALVVSRSTTRRPTGTISAPPKPCTIRIATSMGRVELAAQAIEARVKTAMATARIRRPPNRSVSQPLTGMPAASAIR